MIDFHTHILPEMDDGSYNASESVEMLKTLYNQGAHTVVSTSHFYIEDNDVDTFLERRKRSISLLQSELKNRKYDIPKITLGAEVAYFPEMASVKNLKSLCITGTNYLLLEMPFERWSGYIMRSLSVMMSNLGVKPIIAHVDRYMRYQNKWVFDVFQEMGIEPQLNCSFINGFFSKKKAIRWINDGYVNLIGSDCHNMNMRSPDIQKSIEIISDNLGREKIIEMNEYGCKVLSGTRYI